MPGVTISAGYGAGGSVVAPQVARLLGVPLLDRAISSHVAAQLSVSVQEAEGGAVRRSLPDRFISALIPLAAGVLATSTDTLPRDLAPPPGEADLFRQQAEAIMRAALVSGAVILGRAGAAAFRTEPGVLRVRLFGPPEARIAQAARIENTDEATARQRLPEVDRARAQYVRRLYRADIDDPDLFHLHIDSTALPLDACASLIVSAYRAG
ncbi:MAG TPA: cytidylate kinase-like family protein [Streptosporangiaceae bacterium]|jgi:cytidylate kinase